MTNQDLCLYEELMLLALSDKAGVVTSSWYGYAIGGAVLSELLMLERLEVVDDKVEVLSLESTGDPLLDDVMRWVGDESRSKTIQHWVSKITAMNNLKHRSVEGLCDSGILKADKGKVLFIFDRKIYPEIDPAPELELRERIVGAVESDGPIDARTAVVIAIAEQTGLMTMIFPKKKLKEHKARIKDICAGDDIGEAAKKAIEAQQMVTTILLLMPVIISS